MRASRSALLASLFLSSVVLYACSSDEGAPAGAPQDDTAAAAAPDGGPAVVLGPSLGGDAASEDDAATDAGAADASSDAGDAGDGGDAGDAGDAAAPFDVYDQAIIPKLEITLDAAALAVFAKPFGADADNKAWVKGTFKCGDTTLLDVGFRRKGSSTFLAYPGKMSLKVKFNKNVKGQTCFGLKELTLNNGTSDPTFLAERLSYYVFRAEGLPAQRANSAELYLNGAYWGLYANVETPNEDFIERVYGKASAKSLYEANYGGAWDPDEDLGGFDIEEGDQVDLKTMFTAVKAAKPATLLDDVASVLDTAQFLKYSATEGVIGHYDGYGFGIYGSAHNYYVAGSTDGKFTLIPWSTDLTFSDRETKGATTVNVTVPKNIGDAPSLLVRCKTSATCWPQYLAQVEAVLASYESLKLVDLARTWNAQIADSVARDTKTTVDPDWHADDLALLYGWLAARPAAVRAQLK